MSRKETLRSLLAGRGTGLPAGNSPLPQAAPPLSPPVAAPLVRAGAVGAMSRTLGQLAQAAEDARSLVASGETVLELDPGLVDGSFLSDRLEAPAADHDALAASIAAHGQQVPILVRPHPKQEGRYQIAYGRRRLRAIAALGRPVRAVVKTLSDEELVVAQGQENTARMDLSYIERASFAAALEDRGFGRDVIMAALSVEKTQLSKLIAVARAVPAEIVQAIGPAPKTGRPKWMELAERLARKGGMNAASRVLTDPAFAQLGSDARFMQVLNAVTVRNAKPAKASAWSAEDGRKIVRYRQGANGFVLEVDERLAPSFGKHLVAQLPELYRSFLARGAS
jgi:ParB family transcriptional regulator, chromosome partitioning protein